MTKREWTIIVLLAIAVLFVCCAFSLVLAIPTRNQNFEQDSAVAIAPTSRSSDLPAGIPSQTSTTAPTPTRTQTLIPAPTPTRTQTPTPKPTRPANWVCYKQLGGGFEMLRPASWILDWEDDTGAYFYTNANHVAAFLLIISDESYIRGDLNPDTLEAKASQLSISTFTRYQRGNRKGTWGQGGYYTEFILGDEIRQDAYVRVFFAVVPIGRKVISLMYYHLGQSGFTNAEMNTLSLMTAYLGAC